MIAIWTLLPLALALGLGPDVPSPKGTLVIDGGGQPSPDVKRKALAIAGGPKARVVILPQASDLPEAAAKSEKRWRDAGAENVSILLLDDRAAALESIRAADLVWIGGGDQARLMRRLEGTGVPEAIVAKYRDGGVVGGSSAGAAVMSGVMIARSVDDYPRPLCDYPLMGRGLGLWPGVIVDQHFLKLKRLPRLKRALADSPGLVGVGIDESTAAFVHDGTVEVVGKSRVTIVDPRTPMAKVPAVLVATSGGGDAPAPDTPEPAVHSLEPGMTFHLERGIISGPIAESR